MACNRGGYDKRTDICVRKVWRENALHFKLIYAEYNQLNNSIDITTFDNYILRIDCNKAEDGLKTTLCSQNAFNALAIDELLEYARFVLHFYYRHFNIELEKCQYRFGNYQSSVEFFIKQ